MATTRKHPKITAKFGSKKDPYVFVEWRENKQYIAGNYRESQLPTLLEKLRRRVLDRSSTIENNCIYINEEVEVKL